MLLFWIFWELFWEFVYLVNYFDVCVLWSLNFGLLIVNFLWLNFLDGWWNRSVLGVCNVLEGVILLWG